MPPPVNLRSSAVKRIMQEARDTGDPDTDGFVAAPLESDMFEWHCTLRGVVGTEFEGGLYHLRVLLPATYPMSAPDIVLLTPNGRFELDTKICIDGLTSFHAGSWQPAWGVRTAITGLRAFWGQGGEALSSVGALDVPKAERRRLAKLSRAWTCATCGVPNEELLADPGGGGEVEVEQEAEAEAELEPAPASSGPSGAVVETAGEASSAGAAPPAGPAPEPEPAQVVEPPPHPQPAPPSPPLASTTPPRTAIAITPPQTQPLPRRLTPLWLDAAIGGLMALLVALLLRNGI